MTGVDPSEKGMKKCVDGKVCRWEAGWISDLRISDLRLGTGGREKAVEGDRSPRRFAWAEAPRSSRGSLSEAARSHSYARIGLTTFPAMSVRRKSRPAWRKVSFSWLRPSRWR